MNMTGQGVRTLVQPGRQAPGYRAPEQLLQMISFCFSRASSAWLAACSSAQSTLPREAVVDWDDMESMLAALLRRFGFFGGVTSTAASPSAAA